MAQVTGLERGNRTEVRGKLLLTNGSTIAGLTLAGWVGRRALPPGIRQGDPRRLQSGDAAVTFFLQLKGGAEAAARAGGDDIAFLDANGDVNKQNNDIENLITGGVNVLIINPVNPGAVALAGDAMPRPRAEG
jgi:ribose transport system substrate-binding protein